MQRLPFRAWRATYKMQFRGNEMGVRWILMCRAVAVIMLCEWFWHSQKSPSKRRTEWQSQRCSAVECVAFDRTAFTRSIERHEWREKMVMTHSPFVLESRNAQTAEVLDFDPMKRQEQRGKGLFFCFVPPFSPPSVLSVPTLQFDRILTANVADQT